MRRYIPFLLCLLLLLSLASCHAADQQGQGSTAPTTTNPTATSDPLPPSNAVAMAMYEAAIHDEIRVVDERLGEIALKDCCFPSDSVRFGDHEILCKAILDMDGDGIVEYILQSPSNEHIVLHYENNTVYSYRFDRKSFFNLNTDGSFYWIDSSESNSCTRGCSRLAFEGASLRIKEIYKINQTSPYHDGVQECFVNGLQVTYDEFGEYYDSNLIGKRQVVYSPLDRSCVYPISSEKAVSLASEHWDWKSGMTDGAAGSVYVCKIVILEKPSLDTQSYHIGLQWEGYANHVVDVYCAQPPRSVRIYEELWVDAMTGECRESTSPEEDDEEADPNPLPDPSLSPNEIAIKKYEQFLMRDLAYCTTYEGIPLPECENLGYAYVDLDGDSVQECIIDCTDTLILRYYEGEVYSYKFSVHTFYYLKTDGSYSWSHNGSDFEYGVNQLYFDGPSLRTRELWRIVNDGEPDAAYYIGGGQVTREELLTYFENNPKTRIEFSPLEASWSHPISRNDAITIAWQYWGEQAKENRVQIGYNRHAPSSVYVLLLSQYMEGHWTTIDEIWIDKTMGITIPPFSTTEKNNILFL